MNHDRKPSPPQPPIVVIHTHKFDDAQLDKIVRALGSHANEQALTAILNLLQAINGKATNIMATLEDIQKDMTEEETLIGGLGTLIAGLKQQIADALSGQTLPPAVQAKVDAVFAQAEKNKQALTTALAANTPAETPLPV